MRGQSASARDLLSKASTSMGSCPVGQQGTATVTTVRGGTRFTFSKRKRGTVETGHESAVGGAGTSVRAHCGTSGALPD